MASWRWGWGGRNRHVGSVASGEPLPAGSGQGENAHHTGFMGVHCAYVAGDPKAPCASSRPSDSLVMIPS